MEKISKEELSEFIDSLDKEQLIFFNKYIKELIKPLAEKEQ